MGNTIPFRTGQVQIERKIGDGGFSQVYLAKDRMERKYAVKVMGYGNNETFNKIKSHVTVWRVDVNKIAVYIFAAKLLKKIK